MTKEQQSARPARPARSVRGGRVARTAPLVGLAGRTAGEAVVNSLRKKVRGGDSTEFHTRTAARYAEELGRSKGVLMKAGQILSFVTVSAGLDSEYVPIYQQALARLQDDAPPMSPELAAEVVESELGAAPDALFAAFDPVPLAAASIGQVHAATLHDGRRVAVKIQYPGVEKAIRADLANTEVLATFLRVMRAVLPAIGSLDTNALAREISARIGEEIDYETEAANQRAFADAYRGHPFIRIPDVIPELSTRRILTTDLVDGLRWTQAQEADPELRSRWGEIIFRFSLGSMRRFGLFHADPHPGNYLFQPDGSVTFLDFGCVKRITQEQLDPLKELVSATLDADPERTFRCLVRAGFVDEKDAPDPVAALAWFRDELQLFIAPQPFTYTPEFAAEVVQRVFSPVGPHADVVRKITMPPQYVFQTRIDLGMTAVLGALRTTGPWNAIREEWDCGGPPATALGELEAAHLKAVHLGGTYAY